MSDSIGRRAIAWVCGTDTGISSKTIFRVLMGEETQPGQVMGRWGESEADVPHDSADFGRCFRLLKKIPEWRERLSEVAIVFPAWSPFVREWEHLEALYRVGYIEDVYQLIKQLEKEGRLIEGFTPWGTTGWERKPDAAVDHDRGRRALRECTLEAA